MNWGQRDRGCGLCQLRERFEDGQQSPEGRVVVAYVDDDLLGLVPVDRPGVLVAPRPHVDVPFGGPERSGAVLAALRRAVDEVKWSSGAAEATVEPSSDAPAATGHICYYIAPVLPPGGSKIPVDIATRTQRLVDILRRQAVP